MVVAVVGIGRVHDDVYICWEQISDKRTLYSAIHHSIRILCPSAGSCGMKFACIYLLGKGSKLHR